MRRIRGTSGSEFVILEPTKGGSRGAGGFVSVSVETPRQCAADTDVRKLLDRLRLALGDELRGRSTPQLMREWFIGPITGTGSHGVASIQLTSRNGQAYLQRNAPEKIQMVLPRVTREWLHDAIPQDGDGVGTESTAHTSGGPLPLRARR
jgi:hypothetical protein